MKQVYNFDPYTREYIGPDFAQPDPRTPGRFLMPANSTELPPLNDLPKGYTQLFVNNEWVKVRDLRGRMIYNKASGQAEQCRTIGELTEHWTDQAPPSWMYSWDAGDNCWKEDIVKVRQNKQAEDLHAANEEYEWVLGHLARHNDEVAAERKPTLTDTAHKKMLGFKLDIQDAIAAIQKGEDVQLPKRPFVKE